MKTIETKIALIGMIFFLTLSGCSKNGIFKSNSIKIIGTWKMDKVKFLKDFSFARTDETANFNQFTYVFNEDESMSINTPGINLLGTWRIQETYDSNTQNSYGTNCALVSAVSNSNGTISIYNWNNLYVNKTKITGEERRNGGTYYYTLIKQ